jgi:hypothetical protein
MAPYNPPESHYAHLKVDLYDKNLLSSFMGDHGHRFYKLTRQLKVRYIWWNQLNNVIEVWGPYESLRDNHPIDVIHAELEKYADEYESKNMSEYAIRL